MANKGIRGFYLLTDKIKQELQADDNVNTVTYGDITQVDLDKQTIFPLSHMIVNNVSSGENTLTFNISILAMDVVDFSNDEASDSFVGNNNEQDVFNTQLESLYVEQFQVIGEVAIEPFRDRFENELAGWTATFDVMIQNDIDVC